MVWAARDGLLIPLKPGDRLGRLREKFLLEAINAEHTRAIRALEFNNFCRVAMVPPSNNEWFESKMAIATDLLDDVVASFNPWEPRKNDKKGRYKVPEDDLALWESAYGKLDDPATQEKIANTVKWLDSRRRRRAGKKTKKAK